MKPRRRPDLLPHSAEQRVVDEDLHRLPVRDQQADDQLRGGDAQVIGVPRGRGEEGVRPVMRPQPRQPGPGEHATDRPLSGLREETAGQHGEGTERRRGEQRREHGQQPHQRRRDRRCGIREHQDQPHQGEQDTPGRCRASWTACRTRPTSRPETPLPPGSPPTSPSAGPASASPKSATAASTAMSPPACQATANPRLSSGSAGKAHPTTGPSASTKPAQASTPKPNSPAPSEARPAPQSKASTRPSSSTQAPRPRTEQAPRKTTKVERPGKVGFIWRP